MKVEIVVGEGNIVNELLEEFNKKNNLDLKILKIEALEVNFVTVGSKKMTTKHVFELGMLYEFKLAELRAAGKIL
jgi:hypothetical protein